MRKLYLTGFLFFVSALSTSYVLAQDSTLVRLKQIVSSLHDHEQAMPAEQIYVQTDKPYYAIDDTLRLKAYVLNANFESTGKSGIMYIELINDSSKVVSRMQMPLQSGVGWAAINLNSFSFYPGAYTLRCYTNWMRNFGVEHFFTRDFYIGNTSPDMWLVTSTVNKDKQQYNLALRFTNTDETPIALQDMRLKVYQQKKQVYNEKVVTGIDGITRLNFNLTDSLHDQLTVTVLSQKPELRTMLIPISLAQPINTDLQFMPEGGNLIAGLPIRVAFKALNSDGLGVNVKGTILDSHQQTVAKFASVHKGMGNFELNTLPNEIYTASLDFPDGTHKKYPLPAVKPSGTTLRIDNLRPDSISLYLNNTPDYNGSYMLIIQSHDAVCYASVVQLTGRRVTKSIAKNMLPDGIARFSLLNSSGRPVNERLVFIDQRDKSKAELITDKPTYQPGDSISLNLHIKNSDGEPFTGTFSLAVTDDDQVKTDDRQPNIWLTMMLAAGVKGNIEEPGYYLNTDTLYVKQAIDLLLLTQGWTAYNWQQATAVNLKPAFQPETEFTVSGKVTNVFNKGVTKGHVVMLAPKQGLVLDTLTDEHGRFTFTGLPLADTIAYNIQARNKNGKSFNVGVEIDEFKAPPVAVHKSSIIPWYVNTDNTLVNYIRNNNKRQNSKDDVLTGPNVLKEVKIKAIKVIKGSHNLNGPGMADLVLDEKDMEKAGKKSLLDILTERVKGFHDRGYWYFINSVPVITIVDGMALHKVLEPFRYWDYRDWLANEPAEDIKGIEVIRGNYYRYRSEYIDPRSEREFAFLEITTRGGKGAFNARTAGTYLYKPMPFALEKQFYRPRYPVKNERLLKQDLRSTIHWEPNVITDSAGNAKVSFYAAGKPATYTVIIEGSDLNGHIAYYSSKIKISK